MKSVCIVGAGPGGLVSAKTFLDTGKFEVTVFEEKDRIGGIWALDEKSENGFLSPWTPTNLSRFTVGFSDLDWNSVDYDSKADATYLNGPAATSKPPMFPKAWMANRYLEAYKERYVPDSIIKCSCKVVEASVKDTKWEVLTKHSNGDEETHEFDYLIMASGFFARPRTLDQNTPGLVGNIAGSLVKTIHTSEFRQLADLFPPDTSPAGKTILMLGGGNSSGETAAAVALQLSDAQWSPDKITAARYKGCKIVHVTPRPIYALPHFHEYEQGSKSYVPLDLKLYDFARRPQELGSYAGRQTMEVRNMVHGLMQTMVGGDQSDISPSLVSHKGESRGSSYVALTESYSEYVRSGLIQVISGRVTSLEPTSGDGLTAIVQQQGDLQRVHDIGAVINASGYTPAPALDLLDDATKRAIDYYPASTRLPMILEQWQTMSKAAPNVSFIGFYEGPYWPMMEMQARLTAHRWLTGNIAEQNWYETAESLLDLRQAMQSKTMDVPQFWFSDYLGYLQDIADELCLFRNNGKFGERQGCTSPARYLSKAANKIEADSIMNDLHQTWHHCLVNGRYVARAAFRALHGDWKIHRRIESAVSTFPSGKLEGTASFHPRLPTSDRSRKVFDLEYLYIETGTFTTSTGHIMTASRRYVYRYSEAEDTLSIWFVKPESPLEVDYLFHDLTFVKPEEARKAGACIAKADHLCVDNMYWTEYRLPMNGIALRKFEITHTVKGPGKDYVTQTTYERPRAATT
jgi:hypothetical protein